MIVTYTASITLAILRDDFTRLDRQGLVMFLESARKRMDGSLLLLSKFAGLIECEASLQVQWRVQDTDLRLTYCAFVISALLNDLSGVDVEKSLEIVRRFRVGVRFCASPPSLFFARPTKAVTARTGM